MRANTIDVAVIGLGPRGLSVLERLCANAAECLDAGVALTVHVVDEHLFEGGRVWRITQHPEMLMNTVASQASMFLDDSVDCAGPVVRGPSLHEWAHSAAIAELPERLRAEAARLGADSYPSRVLYGYYLRWTLWHVLRSAPATVTVVLHRNRAVDLRDGPAGTQEIALDSGRSERRWLRGLDAVVLAQGHLSHELDGPDAALAEFAESHGLHYIPPGNPAEADLAGIGAGDRVVLRGLGLNFFDHMALLTVGRGGHFARDRDSRLVYHPSGLEPRLVAGSRRGVPFHARGANEKGPYGRHTTRFLTPAVIDRLRASADRGAPADFRRDIWPLLELEVRAVYYAALVRQRSGARRARAFTDEFVSRAVRRTHCGISGVPEDNGVQRLLTEFGIDESVRWDWAAIETPYGADALACTADYRRWLRGHVDNDVREATRGNVRGPLKAALDVLRDLRNEIRLLVDHGGLSGDSYRDDLQRWYTPLNAYLSIGPPVHRIEQFGALLDCGLLEVLGPGLRVAPGPDGQFLAHSTEIPDIRVRATALIEARMPGNDLRRTTDPLLRSLLARGECAPYRIPIRGGGWYTTGGIAVTRGPYRLLDARYRPHPHRFAFGVPTETVHWATAAGVRPGVNSVILSDADALARAALGVADRSSHPPAAEFVTP
ncbi:FAD/NAD(P)-binding protein [Nocardia sp. NPDC051832]|uniref:FAD/NAD(P)-binding protein n=1 Tax=Nocardia sp. NPDC051832 TaxID=3155673 RepID=UPI003419FC5A